MCCITSTVYFYSIRFAGKFLRRRCPGFYRFFSLYLRDSTSHLREIIVLVFEFHVSLKHFLFILYNSTVYFYSIRFAGSPTEVGAHAGACFHSYGGVAPFFIAPFLHLREIIVLVFEFHLSLKHFLLHSSFFINPPSIFTYSPPTEVGAPAGACFNSYGRVAPAFYRFFSSSPRYFTSHLRDICFSILISYISHTLPFYSWAYAPYDRWGLSCYTSPSILTLFASPVHFDGGDAPLPFFLYERFF